MAMVWRSIVALVLVAGTAIPMLTGSTDASTAVDSTSVARVAAENDNDDICHSGNPRKLKKCHYNGWDVNDNSVTIDASATNATASNDTLTVDLWRSLASPIVNEPFMIAIAGSGAPIARIWWWAEGPGSTSPSGDDLTQLGQLALDCGGSPSCSQSWAVVPRSSGLYTVHAYAQDTAGRQSELTTSFSVTAR